MAGEITIPIESTDIIVQVETPGASKFIELEDAPQTYEEGKYLKSTANGLVYDVPQGGGDMLMSIYDPNGNDIVDYAEGVRVLTAFPTSSKQGDMVAVSGKAYINL